MLAEDEMKRIAAEERFLAIYPMLAGTEKGRTDRAYKLVKELEEVELLLQPQPDNTPVNDTQRSHINKLMNAIQQLKFDAS